MRAVFLDRDGVICLNRPDHIKRWREFIFLSRAHEALARLAMLDMPIIVITNQAAINRGLVSTETVEEIHYRMVKEIEAAGGRIDGVYYCPHRPDESCNCRKPQMGLLKKAAADLGIELEGSYLVGDALSDIQAGLKAGCIPYLVLSGRGLRQVVSALREAPGRFQVVRDLQEAVTDILLAEGHAPYQMVWSRAVGKSVEPENGLQFSSVKGLSPSGRAPSVEPGQESG
jgi:D-glycero-D-manno-heptose 1,7-bisphosphate phosphatase